MLTPSMAEVARRAGVSKNTVSLALRGSPRVTAETRERVEAAARELGYRLNPTVAHRGRAEQLGYTLDEFWLHDPELPIARWQSIFRTRNIRGAVVVGMMQSNRLPPRFRPLWDDIPVLVTGVRTRAPALSYACSDHHSLALLAFEKAAALGYRRPGLVLDGVIDDLIEGRFTAGFLAGQSRFVAADQRTEPFHQVAAARTDRGLFVRWLKKNRPDVIFTLYHEVDEWLRDAGVRVPEDIGLVQYEWRADHGEWAGMDQRNDLVGEAAVDMLVSMVHHNERGVPEHPRATMIGCHWVEGRTVRDTRA